MFYTGLVFLSTLMDVNSLSCNINEQSTPQIVNVVTKESIFFLFSIKTNKCSGSSNNINNLYAQLGVPDVAKNLNVKLLNLMSRTNETSHIE